MTSRRGNLFLLSLEAFFGGFYVAVTRSLLSIYLAVIGFTLKDALCILMTSSILSLLLVQAAYAARLFDLKRLRGKTVVTCIAERVAWCTVPLTSWDKRLLTLDLTIANFTSIALGVYINAIIFTGFDYESRRRLFPVRYSLGAISNIAAQVISIAVLMTFKTTVKYLFLYATAFAFGISSALLLLTACPKAPVTFEKFDVEKGEVKVVNAFAIYSLFTASGTVLSYTWPIYLIRQLNAPDYLALSMGLIGSVISTISPIAWLKSPPYAYRLGMTFPTFVPLLITLIPNPIYHLGIQALYAYLSTGATLLVSFMYSDAVKGVKPEKASTLLSSSLALGQAIGLSLAYLMAFNPVFVFTISSVLYAITALTSYLVIPEIAVVKEHVDYYSRLFYSMLLFMYNTLIDSLRTSLSITIKLLMFLTLIFSVYFIYRLIYHLTLLSV